jgi:hypothetical protein
VYPYSGLLFTNFPASRPNFTFAALYQHRHLLVAMLLGFAENPEGGTVSVDAWSGLLETINIAVPGGHDCPVESLVCLF